MGVVAIPAQRPGLGEQGVFVLIIDTDPLLHMSTLCLASPPKTSTMDPAASTHVYLGFSDSHFLHSLPKHLIYFSCLICM